MLLLFIFLTMDRAVHWQQGGEPCFKMMETEMVNAGQCDKSSLVTLILSAQVSETQGSFI